MQQQSINAESAYESWDLIMKTLLQRVKTFFAFFCKSFQDLLLNMLYILFLIVLI
jgi:hypothetical protein